jgi:hypothetical protein
MMELPLCENGVAGVKKASADESQPSLFSLMSK